MASEEASATPFRAWLMVAVLVAAYAMSFVDRQILGLLVQDLKHDLAISDSQIGLLQGPAFGVFYAVMGLPLGWLADRSSRIRLIAGGLLLWTVMTLLGGLSNSFPALAVTRMGVGIGEAALVPAAVSLLSGSFAPDKRAFPLAVFTGGVSVGAGLALVLGGSLVAFAGAGAAELPMIGPHLAGRPAWQAVLILAGLAGIPLALLVLTLREPPRRRSAPAEATGGLFDYITRNRRVFVPLLAGTSLLYLFSNALAAWMPSLFVRSFGWTPAVVGVRLGGLVLLGALIGNLASGAIATALNRRGRPDGALLTMIGGAVLLLPLAALGPLASTAASAQAAVPFLYFAIALCFGVATASIVAVTPPDLRGRMVALYLLLGNLVGLGLGPPSVGLLLDGVLRDGQRVGAALAILALPTILAGAVLLRLALGPHAKLAAAIGVSLLAGCATLHDRPLADIPKMVRLAPGRFIAGSASAETDAVHYPAVNAAREQPARRVTIAHAFAIGRTEVTRDQFARFAAATGWTPDGPCSFQIDGPPIRWEADRAHDWMRPGFAQTGAHPVVCVNIADAQAYAAWLSKATGRHFRLPSNTEWEYAARAGTMTPVYWGGRSACLYANVLDASSARAHLGGKGDPALTFTCDDGYPETAPVGSFRPNAWGLHDMIGNVWEMTLDCLSPSQTGAPSGATPRTDGDCGSHIDRGSSWDNTRKYVRAAAQHPDLIAARTVVLGFRLAEDLR